MRTLNVYFEQKAYNYISRCGRASAKPTITVHLYYVCLKF